MIRKFGSLLFMGVLVLCIPACESDGVGRTVSVKGKVTVNGQVLKRGSVAYWPEDAKATPASGEIGEDGTYELKTKMRAGAPPGVYKVTVVSQEPIDSTKASTTTAKSPIPDIYSNKDKTPLKREVKDGAPAGAYDLDIK
jgi:hypothetical protein